VRQWRVRPLMAFVTRGRFLESPWTPDLGLRKSRGAAACGVTACACARFSRMNPILLDCSSHLSKMSICSDQENCVLHSGCSRDRLHHGKRVNFMSGINSVGSLNYKPFQHISQVASQPSTPSTSTSSGAIQASVSSANTGSTTTSFRDQLASAMNKVGNLPSRRSASGHHRGHRPTHGRKGVGASPLGIG